MTLTPQETVTLGVHAEQLLKDPTLNLAVDNMLQNIHEAFASPTVPDEDLPELKRRLGTVQGFLGQLKMFMDDAALEKATMEANSAGD